MATFSPAWAAARLMKKLLTPSQLGWSMARMSRLNWSRKSRLLIQMVWWQAPYCVATCSARGTSSLIEPRNSSKPRVTVRSEAAAYEASAVSVVLSRPEERNTPTGTSAMRWWRTESERAVRRHSAG